MLSINVVRDSEQGLLDHTKVASVFGATVAFAMTFSRLYVRRGRWWWDDAIAAFCMTFMVFTNIVLNVHLLYDTKSYQPISTRIALYYLFSCGFYVTMWSFRIAVLLSLIRLNLFRRLLYPAISLYVLLLLVICAQVVWTCERQLVRSASCTMGSTSAIVNIAFSVVADSLLLITPLYALYINRSVPLPHRVRLAIVFGTNILVTMACMVHSIYVLREPQVNMVLLGILQLTLATVVVNLPVVSAALHRVYTHHLQPHSTSTATQLKSDDDVPTITTVTSTILNFSDTLSKPTRIWTQDQGQEQVWSLCIDDRDIDIEGQKLSISIPNGVQEEEYELFDVEDIRSPTSEGSSPESPSSSSSSSPSPVALSRTRTLSIYQPGYK